ncbi:BspA family leucine-rich repeat surface protein [Candidatus Saccharibacteria bacterium]|nr:BspA family leucine-rich repeat surface protein [Candidatus Saccharibacteria bacterium]MCL1963331.1 BspA family leucine-rich repeat surface protein [Candidatus Saccharibacteria bacterium]
MGKAVNRLKNLITITVFVAVLLSAGAAHAAGVIAGEVNSSTASHLVKINVYDSTSLNTMLETCDQIRADQEKNHSYTEESYQELMQTCEKGQLVLDCLNEASQNQDASDASECDNPDIEADNIEDAINNLELIKNGGGNTTPPNTGIWNVKLFGREYAIPVLPFVVLSVATAAAMAVTLFLVRRHIKNNGIGGVKVKNLWDKNNYKLVYESNLVKKHQNDPLTEILDVSQIVRKYRIKFILWHVVPVVAIAVAFFVLLIVTTPTKADSQYAGINLATTGDVTTTIINVDKALFDPSGGNPTNTTIPTKIEQIETSIHNGGAIDPSGGVFAKYSPQPVGGQTVAQFASLLNNLTLTTNRTESTAPGGGNLTPNTELTQSTTADPAGPLLIPATFSGGDLNGNNAFDHAVAVNFTNIPDIDSGTYNIQLTYTITVEEPAPPQEFTFTVDTTLGTSPDTFIIPTCGKNNGNVEGYDWTIYIDKYTYDNNNQSMDLTSTNAGVAGMNETGNSSTAALCPGIVIHVIPGVHTITIASNGPSNYAWARAFGFANGVAGAGSFANKRKVLYLNTPMPYLGFMNSPTDASYAFSYMFSNASNLLNAVELDVRYINMSAVTNFSNMFVYTHASNTNLQNPMNISNLDTSGGVNFSNMFYYTYLYGNNLTEPTDTSHLNTSNGVDFSHMFHGIHYSNPNMSAPINVATFDTSKGVNFSYMFSGTHGTVNNITEPIDVSHLDTSNGTNFASMFSGTHSANTYLTKPLDVSHLDTSKGTDFSSMFRSAHVSNNNLTETLDVSHLDTTNGVDFSNMFYDTHGSNGLLAITAPLDVSNLNTSNGTNFAGMFYGTHFQNTYLTAPLDVSNLNTSKGTDFSNMFKDTHRGNTALTIPLDVSNLDTSNGTNFSSMFDATHVDNTVLTVPLDISNLNTSNGIDFSRMFSATHSRNLNLQSSINISGLNTANGTNFANMFNATHTGNTSLTTPIDPSHIDVTNATGTLTSMFTATHSGNTSLTNAALGNMRFHNSIKAKYSLWDLSSSGNWANTFFQTFDLPSPNYDAGAEPRFNDGTVLSSAGPTNLSSWNFMPYAYRYGITPAPVNTGWR